AGKSRPHNVEAKRVRRRAQPLRAAPRGEGRRAFIGLDAGVVASSSASQAPAEASLGMRQSPRGDRLTDPTLGPSGLIERLNCWSKNRVTKTRSHRRIAAGS